MLKSVRCQMYRGGTSKGPFFLESDLPPAGPERDRAILRIMGSPDVRQIDGIGGAVSTTSKIAIISRSSRPDCDVDYTFGQVSLDEPLVSYDGNCGNMLSAVGPFAIDNALVPAQEGETLVRIYNTNTKKCIDAYVPTQDGRVEYEGDFHLPGVPGTSSEIRIAFRNPAGAVTGSLLPTGNLTDELDIPGFGRIIVSFVDSVNPGCFIRACDVGMTGTELPEEIDADAKLSELLETIRAHAAVRLGFITDPSLSRSRSPAVPKMIMISEPKSYPMVSGGTLNAQDTDIICRMMSMQRAHRTFAFSAALCTASACAIEGTLPARLCRAREDRSRLRVGHTDGIITAGVIADLDQAVPEIRAAYGVRTARRLFAGEAFYID